MEQQNQHQGDYKVKEYLYEETEKVSIEDLKHKNEKA